MNKSLAAFFLPVEFQDAGNRMQSLQQISADWDKIRAFTAERIKDAEDIAQMLSLRVDAEVAYAMSLEKIS